MTAKSSNYGSFIAAVHQERKDDHQVRVRRSHCSYWDALARALELGFTGRQAPFVASAVRARGPATVGELRVHLAAMYPWLFIDEGEG